MKIKVNKEMLEYLDKHSADLRSCGRVTNETIGIGELLTWDNIYATKEESNLPEGLFDNGNVALLQTIDSFETFLPICLLPEIEKEIQRQREEQKRRIKEEKQLKRIYISGPISGHSMEECRVRFNQKEKELIAKGYRVFNPLKNGLPFDADTHQHMRRDLSVLTREDNPFDMIYMMKGWNHSAGCWTEFHDALAIGLEVIFEQVGVPVNFE